MSEPTPTIPARKAHVVLLREPNSYGFDVWSLPPDARLTNREWAILGARDLPGGVPARLRTLAEDDARTARIAELEAGVAAALAHLDRWGMFGPAIGVLRALLDDQKEPQP